MMRLVEPARGHARRSWPASAERVRPGPAGGRPAGMPSRFACVQREPDVIGQGRRVGVGVAGSPSPPDIAVMISRTITSRGISARSPVGQRKAAAQYQLSPEPKPSIVGSGSWRRCVSATAIDRGLLAFRGGVLASEAERVAKGTRARHAARTARGSSSLAGRPSSSW